MISKVEGLLEGVEKDRAFVRVGGGLTLEVLLPAYAVARLGGSMGQEVGLHTVLFLESQAQGATIVPRLAGFLTADDRAFYQLFVTTKGIGPKRALRSMTLATAQMAAAIADRDLATLQSLPEVGKRTAETIATTLHDKVARFLESRDATGAGGSNGEAGGQGAATTVRGGSVAKEALEVLLQLGENRAQAIVWVDQAMREMKGAKDVQAVVAEVYRLRGSA